MMNWKKIGIFGIIGFVLLTAGCGTKQKENKVNKDEKVKVNIHSGVLKNQTVDEFEITKPSLFYENDMSTFTAQIKNNSDGEQSILSITVYAKDKKGNVIAELTGYIGEVLSSKETRTITCHTDQDLLDIVSIEYKINRP